MAKAKREDLLGFLVAWPVTPNGINDDYADLRKVAGEFGIKLPYYNNEGCYFRLPAGTEIDTVPLEPFTRALGKYLPRAEPNAAELWDAARGSEPAGVGKNYAR